MNIVLIGFMGAGKSAVGKKLAQELSMQYLDLDEEIEKSEKMSINDIFAKKGENRFRDLESGMLNKIAGYDNCVISAGGGIVLREENIKQLKAIGPLILLWADPQVIYARVKNETHRPLLKVPDPGREIVKILEVRRPIYERAADYKIDTSKMSVNAVAAEVMKWLKSN